MGFKRMFDAVEVHEGEPLRVITSGVPSIPGNSVYEQCKWLEKNDDQIRLLMLREPRGIPATCANLIVPAKDPRASAGFIIMEQTEYPMMSGGNVIAVATALLETGLLPMEEPVTEFNLEAPAGLIHIVADCSHGKVQQVTFQNVPAFAEHLDQVIEVPHLGKVKVDIAWGGMWFCCIDARQFEGLTLTPETAREISRVTALCTQAAMDQIPVEHPDYPGIHITGGMIYQPPVNEGSRLRSCSLVITQKVDFDRPETWSGAIDRGVCGTGTCALMAVARARGELELNEPFINEGLLGLRFKGMAIEDTEIYGRKAICPTVGGMCWIYGYSKWVLDEDDPFPNGFTFGDIW